MSAIIIGVVAGVLVVASVLFVDSVLKIDDPVGAVSVHLVCGIWGTLAVGIFSPDHSLWVQFVGVLAYGAASLVSAAVIFGIIKATLGVRVSEKEEYMGLDIGEHAMEAYDGFQIFTTT